MPAFLPFYFVLFLGFPLRFTSYVSIPLPKLKSFDHIPVSDHFLFERFTLKCSRASRFQHFQPNSLLPHFSHSLSVESCANGCKVPLYHFSCLCNKCSFR
ncbi:hypothetical protein DFJ73DRAFT_836421 [Zopfochytrium polystomum]|nr:hypothetical protein DFJ73DRAFT_836421 [Zopfochytrium polystomum]